VEPARLGSSRSLVREAPQQPELAVGQRAGLFDEALVDIAPGQCDFHRRIGLAGASRGDAKEMRPILANAPIAFGDVQQDRAAGLPQLLSEGRIMASDLLDD